MTPGLFPEFLNLHYRNIDKNFYFANLIELDGKSICKIYPTRTGAWKGRNISEIATYLGVGLLNDKSKRRTRDNISHVMCCFVDLDGCTTLDAVKFRIQGAGLPKPTIIETSPGRFHVKSYLRVPVRTSGKEFQFWKKTQSAYTWAFKDLGADLNIQHDTTRILRNEFATEIYNEKHRERHLVKVHQVGEPVSLSDIYTPLCDAGYIEERKCTPWHISEKKLRMFFMQNPEWSGTQKELSQLTGIPLRTVKALLYKMRKAELFDETIIGKGENRHIKYRFKPYFMRYTPPTNFKGHEKRLDLVKQLGGQECNKASRAILKYINEKIPPGSRNNATFVAGVGLLELSQGRITESEAISTLKPGFDLSNTNDSSFTWSQFCATIRSALKPGREFRFKESALRAWSLI